MSLWEKVFGEFCKHNYELLDKTVLPSKLDVARENGLAYTKGSLQGYCIRKLVIHFKCTKCGNIYKSIESNEQKDPMSMGF